MAFTALAGFAAGEEPWYYVDAQDLRVINKGWENTLRPYTRIPVGADHISALRAELRSVALRNASLRLGADRPVTFRCVNENAPFPVLPETGRCAYRRGYS